MEKPLSIKREEYLQGIISLTNACDLPPCIVLEVLKGIVQEVAVVAQKQLEADRAAWKEAQDEQ